MEFWEFVNWFCVALFWFIIPLSFYALAKYRFAVKLSFMLALNALICMFLKYLLLIPRFEGYTGIGPAFPSFHTQMAFFIATFVSLKYPKYTPVLMLLATFAGISRIMLQRHISSEVIAGTLLGVMFAFLFFKVRVEPINVGELARQSIHFLSVLIAPMAFVVDRYLLATGLLIVMVFLILCSKIKHPLKSLMDMVTRANEQRHYMGAIFLFFSSSVLLLLFPPAVAVSGILAIGIGDSLATIFGKHIGRFKLPYNSDKTLEWSFVAFMAMYVVLYFFWGKELALAAALLAAFVETLPYPNDNLSVPFAVALFLVFIPKG
jgi:dolichol kinase